LGNAPLEFSDDDTTPVNVQKVKRQDNDSLGSTSSFNAKMRPAESRAQEEEIHRLRTQLEDRDKQLKEQAASLAEMENSLNEVQSLMGGSDAGRSHNRNSMEDKDAAHLRALLREKNEKIAMLTSEFDAHRADFRSTIDTLEMAATETERVYESRVQELLMELKDYKEKSDDVYSVAAQLKQLEELVQELEEGLEDARRGESEARSEVEFLQGEVERTKAELRREREKTLAAEQAPKVDHQAQKEIEQRDDEIRGLKAIIHSLSSNEESNGTPRGSISESDEAKQKRENLERQVNELRSIIDRKNSQEEELEREIERLRRSSVPSTANPQRASAMTVASTGTVTAGARFNRGSGGSWREQNAPRSPEQHRRGNTLDTMPESDTYSATTDGSTLWCEICETAGHDILTCTNVFSSKSGVMNNKPSQSTLKPNDSMRGDGEDRWKPAPLSPARRQPPTQPLPAPPVQVMPDPSHDGPVAGKDSGVIDANKWCAVCERDGHDALDCPFEGAF
jgi:chromosome segregation ATPase